MSTGVDLGIGTVLGGYRIEEVVGRGGMGVVYRAEQIRLARSVALKVLAPEYANDASFRERFVRESQIAASIEHPNIIPIYEAGEIDGLLFIAMRFVNGTDLKTRLDRRGRLEPTYAVQLLSQVGSALQAAHASGLIHRDIKPANILIAPPVDASDVEHVYLTDFGIAKRAAGAAGLTRTGLFVGTPEYACPEQIEGKPLDSRADIYGLGCVLYQCLTGSVPYPRDSDVAVLIAQINDLPPVPSEECPELPAEFDQVVSRAMAKDRDERFSTTSELVTAAREAIDLPSTASDLPVLLGAESAATVMGSDSVTGESARDEPTTADPRLAIPTAAAAAAAAATAAASPIEVANTVESPPAETPEAPPTTQAPVPDATALDTPASPVVETRAAAPEVAEPTVPPPPVPPRSDDGAQPPPRRKKMLVIAGVAILCLAAAGAAVGVLATGGSDKVAAAATAASTATTPTTATTRRPPSRLRRPPSRPRRPTRELPRPRRRLLPSPPSRTRS